MHNISSEELETIRGQMLKFATLQLKDPILAEDVVQEAFVSALKNIESFKRQSALKTWIFAILKNKIIDYLRVNHRFVVESELITDEDENSFLMVDVGVKDMRLLVYKRMKIRCILSNFGCCLKCV